MPTPHVTTGDLQPHLVDTPVGAAVVTGAVVPDPVGHRLDQHWPVLSHGDLTADWVRFT